MPYRDLVIFLPGIGGSKLVRDGRTLWGLTPQALASAYFKGTLEELTVERETDADDLGDGIVADSVIEHIQIIPGLWKTDQYGGFCSAICGAIDLENGKNFFQFPYDWRRDNRISAKALQRFAEDRLSQWRRSSGADDARIVLIAHSMGGLVARYFVDCLEGWKTVRRLVTVGTPHRGSLNALGFLVNGLSKGIGPFAVDATKPLRSFASIYQLLPTFNCVQTAEKLSNVVEIEVGNVDVERAKSALEFHTDIRSAAERNRHLDGYAADYLSVTLSAGQPTFQSAVLTDGILTLCETINDKNNGGDGTVPMVSAIPHGVEPYHATYVNGIHAALFAEEPVLEHLAGLLSSTAINMEPFRWAPAKPRIQLRLADAYTANEAFEIEAEVVGAYEQTLTVVARSEVLPPVLTTLFPEGGVFRGALKLPEGAWHIAVSGRIAPRSKDVVLVAQKNGPSESVIIA